MKCPNCNGTGKEYSFYDGAESVWKDAICPTCNGTGEVWQTNEEYMRSCTTEQLAEAIYECVMTHPWHISKEVILEWLKQPHTVKE